jgi:hypothetical protein
MLNYQRVVYKMEREREDTCRKPCITMSQPPLGPSDWDMFDEIGLNLIEPHQVQHKQIPICMVTDRRIEVEIRVWDDIKTKKIKKSRSPQVWRLALSKNYRHLKACGYPFFSHSKTALDFSEVLRGQELREALHYSRTVKLGSGGFLQALGGELVGGLEPWLFNGISWRI